MLNSNLIVLWLENISLARNVLLCGFINILPKCTVNFCKYSVGIWNNWWMLCLGNKVFYRYFKSNFLILLLKSSISFICYMSKSDKNNENIPFLYFCHVVYCNYVWMNIWMHSGWKHSSNFGSVWKTLSSLGNYRVEIG